MNFLSGVTLKPKHKNKIKNTSYKNKRYKHHLNRLFDMHNQ
jgi:hypothetical protein